MSLLTKPGYSAFTEAACHGWVLYAARRDWPEEPYLVAWLKRFGQCLEIPPDSCGRWLYCSSLSAAGSARPSGHRALGSGRRRMSWLLARWVDTSSVEEQVEP
jgi:hypothetical protein